MQTYVKQLRFQKQCLVKKNLNPTEVPLSKPTDKAELDSIVITSKEEANQKQENITVTSGLVLEPPPLVKISEVARKTVPPLVLPLKRIPLNAPPLVPILKALSQAKSSFAAGNSLPTPSLVPIRRAATQSVLDSNVVKSKIPSVASLFVPIVKAQTKTKEDEIPSTSSKPEYFKPSVNVSTLKKSCEVSENPSHPQVKIVKTKSVVPSVPKGPGRAFIMTEDKTMAVEVDLENEKRIPMLGNINVSKLITGPAPHVKADLVKENSRPMLEKMSASNLNTEPSPHATLHSIKEKSKKKMPILRKKRVSKSNPRPVPYVKLKNGALVPLEYVEKVPLDQIPVPPLILMCYSDSDNHLPEVCVKESMTFSEFSSTPPLKLSSGLFVCNYPSGLPPPVKVSPNPSTNTDPNPKKTDIFVLKNSWTSQPRKKKKILAVRTRPKAYTKSACPEALNQIEILSIDPPQYKCKVCDVILSDKKRCEYHVIAKHLIDKCTFECTECGKKFATNFLRTHHFKVKHTRAPDYICSVCGAKFRSLSVLRGHELRHTSQDPPFRCEVCDKGFYTKANCAKHFLDKHMEKTAVCDICGESFAGVGRLNEHRNNHIGGFKCSECGKSFNSKSRLRAHKQVHNTANLMYCTCGKKFATFAFLHNHSKVCQERVNNAGAPDIVALNDTESYGYDTDVGKESDSSSE